MSEHRELLIDLANRSKQYGIRIMPTNAEFITITLPPKLYVKSTDYQREATVPTIYKYSQRYCSDYTYVIEYTQECNIHFHGWIVFKNKSSKIQYMNKMRKSKVLGYIKVSKHKIEQSTLDMQVKCTEYMLKEIQLSWALLKERAVIAPNDINSYKYLPCEIITGLNAGEHSVLDILQENNALLQIKTKTISFD